MQLIYDGTTNQSLPSFKFPELFSLNVNPKHNSNTLESIKIIGKVVIPYVNAQHEILSNPTQAALIIFDVFRNQITGEFTSHLLQNNIYFVKVPNNTTHLFQPLDLTVNIEFCLSVIKPLHTKWLVEYYNHISSEAGTDVHLVFFINNQKLKQLPQKSVIC